MQRVEDHLEWEGDSGRSADINEPANVQGSRKIRQSHSISVTAIALHQEMAILNVPVSKEECF